MKITRVAAKKSTIAAVAILAVSLFSGSLVSADQVDDLLAGKPVEIEAVAGETDAFEPGANRIDVPVERKTVAQESWEVTHAQSSHAGLHASEASQPGQPIGSATTISVVPEPSAIALAALALVYFLIFFRRRYSF